MELPPQLPPQPYRPTGVESDATQVFLPTKNMPALLSYYFGVFGLIPFLGVPLAIAAVVLGIIGLKRFKLNPTPGAKGHAITGLVLGCFELVCLAVFVAFVTYVNG